MPSGKNIYKVLVAGANDKTFALLQTLLPGSSYEPPMRAGSAGEAKRMVMDCTVDIAIWSTCCCATWMMSSSSPATRCSMSLSCMRIRPA